jgi:hypothetical protein
VNLGCEFVAGALYNKSTKGGSLKNFVDIFMMMAVEDRTTRNKRLIHVGRTLLSLVAGANGGVRLKSHSDTDGLVDSFVVGEKVERTFDFVWHVGTFIIQGHVLSKWDINTKITVVIEHIQSFPLLDSLLMAAQQPKLDVDRRGR